MVNYILRKLTSIFLKKSKNELNQKINLFASSQCNLLTRENSFLPEIVIPCFNHGKYLADALSSINIPIPITVVDDASTDETPLIISELKKQYRFKLISNKKNLNQSGSINRAISESDNNLFIILNADDVLLPYTLNLVIDTFKNFPDVRLVGAGSIWFTYLDTKSYIRNFPNKLNYFPSPIIKGPNDAIRFYKMSDLNMSMSGSSFLKSAWLQVGGFYEYEDRVCPYDDRDFQMRVCSVFQTLIFGEAFILYRLNSSTGKAQS
jgi:glycosyltransferase involved in cell wall biosynthesis